MSTSDGPKKSYALFIMLLLILGVSLANQFWPRTPTISTEAVEGIQQVVVRMEKAADSVERNTMAMMDLNKSLILQMRNRTDTDDKDYDAILRRWGIDPQDTVASSANGNLALSLQQQYQSLGSGYLSPGTGTADPTRLLQKPNEVRTGGSHGGLAGATELQPSDARESRQ